MDVLAFLCSLFHALLTISMHKLVLQLCLSSSVLTNSRGLIRQEAVMVGNERTKAVPTLFLTHPACREMWPATVLCSHWHRAAVLLEMDVYICQNLLFPVTICTCHSTEMHRAQTGGQRYSQSICHLPRAMKENVKWCHRSMKFKGIMSAP